MADRKYWVAGDPPNNMSCEKPGCCNVAVGMCAGCLDYVCVYTVIQAQSLIIVEFDVEERA